MSRDCGVLLAIGLWLAVSVAPILLLVLIVVKVW